MAAIEWEVMTLDCRCGSLGKFSAAVCRIGDHYEMVMDYLTSTETPLLVVSGIDIVRDIATMEDAVSIAEKRLLFMEMATALERSEAGIIKWEPRDAGVEARYGDFVAKVGLEFPNFPKAYHCFLAEVIDSKTNRRVESKKLPVHAQSKARAWAEDVMLFEQMKTVSGKAKQMITHTLIYYPFEKTRDCADTAHDSTDANNAVWQCSDSDGDCAFGICDACFRRQHSGLLDVTLIVVGTDDEHIDKRMDEDERGHLADLLDRTITETSHRDALRVLLERDVDDAALKCDRVIMAFKSGGVEVDEVKRAVQTVIDAIDALHGHRRSSSGLGGMR